MKLDQYAWEKVKFSKLMGFMCPGNIVAYLFSYLQFIVFQIRLCSDEISPLHHMLIRLVLLETSGS